MTRILNKREMKLKTIMTTLFSLFALSAPSFSQEVEALNSKLKYFLELLDGSPDEFTIEDGEFLQRCFERIEFFADFDKAENISVELKQNITYGRMLRIDYEVVSESGIRTSNRIVCNPREDGKLMIAYTPLPSR